MITSGEVFRRAEMDAANRRQPLVTWIHETELTLLVRYQDGEIAMFEATWASLKPSVSNGSFVGYVIPSGAELDEALAYLKTISR